MAKVRRYSVLDPSRIAALRAPVDQAACAIADPKRRLAVLHRVEGMLLRQYNDCVERGGGSARRCQVVDWQTRHMAVAQLIVPLRVLVFGEQRDEHDNAAFDYKHNTRWDRRLDSSIDAALPVLRAAEAVATELDPYCDFLADYTEVDLAGEITVAQYVITMTNMSADDAYVYRDMGAGHFAGNYTHLFETSWTLVSGGGGGVYGLTTEIDDLYNNTNFAGCYWGLDGSDRKLYGAHIENTSFESFDKSLATASGQLYYVTHARVGSVCTTTMCTVSHGGTGFDVLLWDDDGDARQYHFGAISRAGANTLTGSITNIDLQEGADYMRTASDSVGVADSAARVVAFARGQADSAGISDALTRAVAFTRAQSDSAGLSDALSQIAEYARTQADSAGVSDTAAAALSYLRAVADWCGASDSAQRIVAFARSLADAGRVSDIAGRVNVFVRSIADAEGLTDAATAELVAATRAAIIAIILEQQTRN